MAIKSDYHKGVTVGNSLAKRRASLRQYFRIREHEIRAEIHKLEDKYRDTIGDLVCPLTGEPAYMRLSWYREGVRDGLQYGHGIRFVVVHWTGQGRYTVESLAERAVYDDPALAWKRSWELDPQGHKFSSMDLLYVNGAAKEFGVEGVYGL